MIASKKFTVTQPTEIHFGVGLIETLADVVQKYNGTKVLLVADPNLQEVGLLAKITAPLDKSKVDYVVFDHIDPEPGLRLADEGCALALKEKCDAVVGVGGGSAMDVAKAVAILMTNGGKAVDYLGLGLIKKLGVPKIMVPTTAGTGAEVTFTAVFINEETGSKGGMNGDPLYPDAAILDPALTVTLPPHVTAAPGIDAFVHAMEAFTSTQSQPISDMYALEAMELISGNIHKAYANGDNLEARSAMMMGSLLGGKALATAGVGLVHAMAYPLGGMFGIPHGLANAVLMPFVVNYNLIGDPEKYARVADIMGYDVTKMSIREAATTAVEAVYNMNQDVNIPTSLAALDIPADKIPEMAEIALTVTRPVENNPRKPSLEDVISIYEIAHKGWE